MTMNRVVGFGIRLYGSGERVVNVDDFQFVSPLLLEEIKTPRGDISRIPDNHRVLHAREGFSGRRHLRLFHVRREEFHNRLRLLSRKLGRDSANLRLSGGALG